MTHEHNVDDGDLEIEEWEKADAAVAASGMSRAEHRSFWNDLDPRAEDEGFLERWAEERGCSMAEAYRQIHELNGVTL